METSPPDIQIFYDKPLAELHRVANLLDSPISDRTNYLNTPNLG